MLTRTCCDICKHTDWQEIGRREYIRPEDGDEASGYLAKRMKVFFEKWFPGHSRVTLKSYVCRRCGFIMYFPRPEEKDIDAKYKYLEELGQDYGHNAPDSARARLRAKDIFRYVSRYVPLNNIRRVLDFGGGDGRMMRSFSEAGKECFLVDYNRNCIKGVTKISDTIDGIGRHQRFDLIICNHVLEHLAEPYKTLRKLNSHLTEGGHMFIEVPMQVWRRPPLEPDPVTHINFFTPCSMKNCLLLGGFTVLDCKMTATPHPWGKRYHAVRALVKKAPDKPPQNKFDPLKPDADKFLNPSPAGMLAYYAHVPERLPKAVIKRITHRLNVIGALRPRRREMTMLEG